MLRRRLEEILSEVCANDLTNELERLVRDLILRYEPLSVIIAGSLATKKFVRGLSDIDILIIVNRNVTDEERFMLGSIKDVDIEITVYNIDEVMKALKLGNQFITEAIRDGIEVYGNLKYKLARFIPPYEPY